MLAFCPAWNDDEMIAFVGARSKHVGIRKELTEQWHVGSHTAFEEQFKLLPIMSENNGLGCHLEIVYINQLRCFDTPRSRFCFGNNSQPGDGGEPRSRVIL